MHKLTTTLLVGLLSLIAAQDINTVVDPTSAQKLQDGFTWVEGALWDKWNSRLLFSDTNAVHLNMIPNSNVLSEQIENHAQRKPSCSRSSQSLLWS